MIRWASPFAGASGQAVVNQARFAVSAMRRPSLTLPLSRLLIVKRSVLTDRLFEHCPESSLTPLRGYRAARVLTCPTLRFSQAVNSAAPRSIQAKLRPAAPLARWAFGACGRLTRRSASHWLRQRGHFCSAV